MGLKIDGGGSGRKPQTIGSKIGKDTTRVQDKSSAQFGSHLGRHFGDAQEETLKQMAKDIEKQGEHLAQRIDIWLFNWIKERYSFSFPIRSSITMLFSQGVDTVLFTTIALSGMAASLLDIMLFSYTVKAILILSLNPALSLTRRIYA